MAEKLINDAVTPLSVNNVKAGTSVATNAAEVMSFILTTGAADAGSAAGTIVYGKTALAPILNLLGDRVGNFYSSAIHTSVSFTNGVIIAAQEKGFVYNGTESERLTLTAAKLTVNGDFAIDYETGLFVIRKATTATSVTITYKSPSEVSGGGGVATDVNLTKVGGVATSTGAGASNTGTLRVTQGSTSMQSQGVDTTGQDAYATIKTPSANATHILASCGSFGAIISLDAGVTDHFTVQPNMALTLDAVTITSGVAIQSKNLVPGSNYTNLAVSIW